jgi:hypothetical protein
VNYVDPWGLSPTNSELSVGVYASANLTYYGGGDVTATASGNKKTVTAQLLSFS